MAKRTIKYITRQLLRRSGFDIVRFRGKFEDLQAFLLDQNQVTLLIDVGANQGQYSQRMRQLGYNGKIVAFEPLPGAHAALTQNFQGDAHFEARACAVSDVNGSLTIHVSRNSVSSSTLPMSTLHAEADSQSSYIGETTVAAVRLDSLDLGTGPFWLKIDVQGAEMAALEGASGILEHIRVLQLEMSLVSLYEGSALAEEVMSWARAKGFRPAFIEGGFQDPRDGRMLQVDGLFTRE